MTSGDCNNDRSTSNSTKNPSNSNDKNDLIAIIIGGGPAGLATAVGLAKVCITVYVVEKHETFDQRGASLTLALNGQKAIREISPKLYQNMMDIGLPSNNPVDDDSRLFVWWEMRDALLHHAQTLSNISIYTGTSFTDIQETSNSVTVKFGDNNSNIKELQGDFLVAADGVHSQVARQILNLPPPIVSETRLFRGSLIVKEEDDRISPELKQLLSGKRITLTIGTGGPLFLFVLNFHSPRHPGRLAWVLATNLDVPDDGTINPCTICQDYIKDNEREKLPIALEIFRLSGPHQLQPYPRNAVVNFSDEVLASYENGGWGGRGRITLVGDAAHGMKATDGFGGSMAFEDALVLSRMLLEWNNRTTNANSAEESQPSTIDGLLREFERARLPRVKKVYDNQHERYNIRMKEGRPPGPLSEEFSDWVFAGV